MRTNIKIFLVALMAMVSMNGWADVTYVTWPAGIYYIEFVGFHNQSEQKVFEFNIFNDITKDSRPYDGTEITLYGTGTCNSNVERNRFDYYKNITSKVDIEVVALSLSKNITMPGSCQCLKLGVGSESASDWKTFDWIDYATVNPPSAFSSGVYYLKITWINASSYSVAWQTSGSLPACANAGHTVTFAANNGSLGSITTAKQGESGSATDISSGSTLITEGTTVRVVATASGSNVFVGWKNSSDEYVSYDADYTFSMPDDNVSLTAVFEVKRQVDGCANCFTVE